MNRNQIRSLAAALTISLGFALPSAQAASEDSAAAESRTTGQTIKDATTTAAIKSSLLADDRTEGFDINVDTVNGHVTLRGGADSLADKLAAGDIAAGTDGVVSVDNQIIVAAEGTATRQAANQATASGEARELLDDAGNSIDDAWITSKVKSKLLADRDVKGMEIDVTTKGNVVYLSGVVEADWVRSEAIQLAQGTRGVREVRADALIVR